MQYQGLTTNRVVKTLKHSPPSSEVGAVLIGYLDADNPGAIRVYPDISLERYREFSSEDVEATTGVTIKGAKVDIVLLKRGAKVRAVSECILEDREPCSPMFAPLPFDPLDCASIQQAIENLKEAIKQLSGTDGVPSSIIAGLTGLLANLVVRLQACRRNTMWLWVFINTQPQPY